MSYPQTGQEMFAYLLKKKFERESEMETIASLRAQLSASQASEARLREALKRVVAWQDAIETCAPELGGCLTAIYAAKGALAQTDPNPLTAVVEAARAWCAITRAKDEGRPMTTGDVMIAERALFNAIAALDQ